MRDDDLRRAYQARPARPGDAPPTPEELAGLFSREGTEAERADRLDRAVADPGAVREFELLRAIEAAAQADQPVRAFARRPLAWLVAAVLLVSVGVATRLSRPNPSTEATRGQEGAIALIEPAMLVDPGATLRFVWHSVPDALSYEVEILDDTDRLVGGATVADTTWTPPDGLSPAPGKSYRWWVVATTRSGTEVRAVPRSLRAREANRP